MKGRPALTLILIFAVGLMLGIGVKALFFADPILEPETEKKRGPKSRQQMFDEADISAEDIELVQGKQGAMESSKPEDLPGSASVCPRERDKGSAYGR